jgi:hypothetical protein
MTTALTEALEVWMMRIGFDDDGNAAWWSGDSVSEINLQNS